MDGLKPVAIYGLNVPSDGDPVEAESEGRATFRITMAAIDPTAKARVDEDGGEVPPFATLKMIRVPGFFGDDDSDDSEDDDEDLEDLDQLLGGGDSEDDLELDDEEEAAVEKILNGKINGTASSAVKKAAVERLKKAVAGEDEDMAVDAADGDLEDDDEDEEEDDEDDDDESSLDLDDDFDEPDVYVICTLDPKKNYQQPLDITINHDEQVFFQVSGAYDITLTGNYLIPSRQEDPLDDMYGLEDEDEYDLSPGEEDELDYLDEDSESDELDDIDDPRIMEVDSEEEAPKLVTTAAAVTKKGKNKRAADESEEETNGVAADLKAADAVNGDAKLSKKQLKKLKKNDGKAVEAAAAVETVQPPTAKSDKKVQFAKELEQGPSSSPKTTEKPAAATNGDKPKSSLGVKVVNGVTIDDKKLGSGPAAKKGNKVSMRYIGKLESNKKVFDSNKKGKPFTFQLGKKEVIQGWEIGVEGMAVGGERRITVPAHLAYGKKGAGADIPPNSTLIFDLKLLEIK